MLGTFIYIISFNHDSNWLISDNYYCCHVSQKRKLRERLRSLLRDLFKDWCVTQLGLEPWRVMTLDPEALIEY